MPTMVLPQCISRCTKGFSLSDLTTTKARIETRKSRRTEIRFLSIGIWDNNKPSFARISGVSKIKCGVFCPNVDFVRHFFGGGQLPSLTHHSVCLWF